MLATLDGRIHLEPGHRTIAESIAARVKVEAGTREREAVKVECSDFDGVRYKVDMPDKDTLCVSLFVRNFSDIKNAVGEQYFQNLYPALSPTPDPMYSLTVKIDLKKVDDGTLDAGAPFDAVVVFSFSDHVCLMLPARLHIFHRLRVPVAMQTRSSASLVA